MVEHSFQLNEKRDGKQVWAIRDNPKEKSSRLCLSEKHIKQ